MKQNKLVISRFAQGSNEFRNRNNRPPKTIHKGRYRRKGTRCSEWINAHAHKGTSDPVPCTDIYEGCTTTPTVYRKQKVHRSIFNKLGRETYTKSAMDNVLVISAFFGGIIEKVLVINKQVEGWFVVKIATLNYFDIDRYALFGTVTNNAGHTYFNGTKYQ